LKPLRTTALIASVIKGGSVKVIVSTMKQPLASVTVTL
jgi:hypothetical protein